MTTLTSSSTTLKDLGDGLRLRASTPADADELADLNARIQSDDGPDRPDEGIRVWTHDLLARPHPTMAPSDFTVVEDTRTGAIVSCVGLIPQTWAYGGLPFGVGRPELVATDPAYRRRGLVREQFAVVHRWSAERGHLAQAITGIPNYYRQFGYEMALALGHGRGGYGPQAPTLKEGEAEPYRVRPATPADLPFFAEVYAQSVAQRDLITCVRDQALWRHELDGHSPLSLEHWELRVIETPAGEPVGYVSHAPKVWTGGPSVRIVLLGYELAPGVSWLAVTPSVIRYLWQTGQDYAARAGLTLQRFAFGLGQEHPVYEAFADTLPATRAGYAWYLRVADVPGFLRHIAPVLEQRLARSVAVGHSAELTLNFFRGGVRLVLERGRLVTAEPWQPPHADEWGTAGFPALTFLQLLFGFRSLAELRSTFPDCYVNGDANRALLNALFPKQASNVWPVA